MKEGVTAFPAWGLTLAAALDLVALIFMSSANSGLGPLSVFAACEVFLIVAAVAFWKRYFEGLIDEKTKKE